MELCPEEIQSDHHRLYEEFSHHLSLNQAEAAAAFFKILKHLKGPDLNEEKLEHILSDIIYYPQILNDHASTEEDLCSFSNTLTHHYLQLYDDKKSQSFLSEINIRSLLNETHHVIPNDEALRELNSCMDVLASRSVPSVGLEVFSLSAAALAALEHALVTDPYLGHQIILHLTAPLDNEQDYVVILQKLYITAMEKLLDHSSSRGVLEDKFLVLFGFFDPPENTKLTDSDILSLFHKIVNCIDDCSVLSCIFLLSLSKRWAFLQQFSVFYEQCATQLSDEVENLPDFMSEGDRVLYFLLTHDGAGSYWKRMLLLTKMRRVHFLKLTVQLLLRFVERGYLDHLERLLSHPVLQRLKTLVLLRSWHLCENLEIAARLLELCEVTEVDIFTFEKDGQSDALKKQCQEIVRHFNMVKQVILSLSHDYPLSKNVSSALAAVGNSSRLHILASIVDLTDVNEEEALRILSKSEVSSPQDTSNESTCCDVLQECDLAVYRAFSAMKSFTEAVFLFHQSLVDVELREDFIERTGDETFGRTSTFIEAHFLAQFRNHFLAGSYQEAEELYRAVVTPRLTRACELMKDVQPLSLRLEVLENAFSLIFTRADMAPRGRVDSGNLAGDEGVRSGREKEGLSENNLTTRRMQSSPAVLGVEIALSSEESWEGRGRSHSSMSASQAKASMDRPRFVCPAFLVRDILLALKPAVEHVKSVCFLHSRTLKQNQNAPELEREGRLSAVLGLTSWEGLQDRVAQLTGALADALWRFELLFGAAAMQPGVVRRMPVTCGLDGEAQSSHGISMKPSIPAAVSRGKRARKHRKRTGRNGTSRSGGASEKDSGRESELSKRTHRQYRRIPSLTEQSCIPSDTVSLLLSDPDTMIALCLTIGNYERAHQVVKGIQSISSSSEAPPRLAGEARFSGYFEAAVEKLKKSSQERKVESGVRQKNASATPGTPGSFGQASLSALRSSVATACDQMAVATGQQIIDQLLSLDSNHHPALPLEKMEGSSPLGNLVSPSCMYAGIIFDLACSASPSLNQLTEFVRQATSRLQPQELERRSSSDLYFCGKNSHPHRIPLLSESLGRVLATLEAELTARGTGLDEAELLKMGLQRLLPRSAYLRVELSYPPIGVDKRAEMAEFCEVLIRQLQATERAIATSPTPSISRETTRASPMIGSSNSGAAVSNSSQSGESGSLVGRSVMESLVEEEYQKLVSLVRRYQDNKLSVLQLLDKSSESQYFRFLDSLFDHLKLFAQFVKEHGEEESQGRSNDKIMGNYFLVLDSSPVKMIGELIFVKRIKPIRMKNTCLRLGLSTSHVILQNCCPQIPTQQRDMIADVNIPFATFPHTIHNGSKAMGESSHVPTSVVNELLSRIIEILTKIINEEDPRPVDPCTGGLLVTSTILSRVGNEPGFRELESEQLAQLHRVDLTQLTCPAERLAFFINLHNLMVFHLTVELARTGVEDVPFRSLEAYLRRQAFCYRVGQLGVISIQEIRSKLLGIPDITFRDASCARRVDDSLFTMSLDSSFAPPFSTSGTQTAVFGLLDATLSSVPLRVYSKDHVMMELNENVSTFISASVASNRQSRKLRLPLIARWYERLLTRDRSFSRGSSLSEPTSSLTETTRTARHEDLLAILLAACSTELRTEVARILKIDTDALSSSSDSTESIPVNHIDWIPRDESVGLVLYSNCPVDTKGEATDQRPLSPLSVDSDSSPGGPNISSSDTLDTDMNASFVSTTKMDSQHAEQSPRYPASLTALDYLRDTSPLLATLAYLLSPDKFVDEEHAMTLVSDHFASEAARAREMSSSDVNLMDVKSYRFQRLATDFPALGAYLKRYWVPVTRARVVREVEGRTDPLLRFCNTTPAEEVRWNLFSHPDSLACQSALGGIWQQLLGIGQCEAVLDLISTLPYRSRVREGSPSPAMAAQDYAAQWLVERAGVWSGDSQRLRSWLYALAWRHVRARETLRCLPLLTAAHGCRLLELCRTELSTDDQLYDQVLERLTQLRVFASVAELVTSRRHHDPALVSRSTTLPPEYTSWPRLLEASLSSPDTVLAALLHARAFQLAQRWAALYMSETGSQKIEAAYLVHLVSNDELTRATDFTKHLCQLMSTDKGGPRFTLAVCMEVVRRWDVSLALVMASGFALRYRLYLLPDCEGQMAELTRAYLGASMVRALPSKALASSLMHLVRNPHLILEQLLMNMKVEHCKHLLELYRVQRIQLLRWAGATGGLVSPEVRWAGASGGLVSPEVSSLDSAPTLYPGDGPAENVLGLDELEAGALNQLIVYYAGKAVEVSAVRFYPTGTNVADRLQRADSFCDSVVSLTTIRPRGGSIADDSASLASGFGPKMVEDEEEAFVMPADPPPKSSWVPDDRAIMCMCCRKERFSMFNRRHHCRRCGRVVCDLCSKGRAVVSGVSARVCDQCLTRLNPPPSGPPSGSRGGLPRPGSRVSLTPATMSPLARLGGTAVGWVDEGWRLSTRVEDNSQIREDFIYEQAPSITLALSLLDLHTHSNECGDAILEMCDTLTSYLRSGPDGRPNLEVDYPLLINTIRNLLYKAKLKYNRLNNAGGTSRCDSYLGRLDLMSILVQANYRRLPAFSDLAHAQKVALLRDQLIHSERLDLAMEVTTKTGLPSGPVWAAMGMRALERGSYTEARGHMARCLRPPPDLNSMQPMPRHLEDVLKLLEGRRMSGQLIGDILEIVETVEDLMDEPEKKVRADISMSNEAFKECMFYLKGYGSNLQYLHFLARHNHWMKATEHALQKKVSPEVFVDSLVGPALSAGKFATLRDQMLMIDETLGAWKPYLDKVCQCLDRKGFVKELYDLQLLMRDYFRAAQTCIFSYFLRNARGYSELASRLDHLSTAARHLESALRVAVEVDKPALKPSDLQKYIKVVNVQYEATRFLTQPACVKHASSGHAYRPKALPTLFSKESSAKVEFCLTVIFSSPVLTDGLSMAGKVIQECRVQPQSIFVRACLFLRSRAASPREGLLAAADLLRDMCDVCPMDDQTHDEIILHFIRKVTEEEKKSPEMEEIVERIKARRNKVEGNLATGRFLPAYLASVQTNNLEEVARVAQLAEEAGQMQVAELAKKRLRQQNSQAPRYP